MQKEILQEEKNQIINQIYTMDENSLKKILRFLKAQKEKNKK